jgi:hypothetical protein
MKIWKNYGSEHSANLVMIGRFKDVTSAKKTMEAIDAIKEYLDTTNEDYEGADRYPDGLLELLQKIRCHSVSPWEFEQFRMDIQPHQEGAKVVINTDEIEVSAFFKLLIDNGAKVEVYSAHDYPDENDCD